MSITVITEGTEYQILMNGKIVYQGIAETDTEAEETLEAYALHASATNNSSKPVRFTIVKV